MLSNMKQTWDLNALDGNQRKLIRQLLDAEDCSDFLPYAAYINGKCAEAIGALRRIGLVEVDGEQADEVYISLTEEGQEWAQSMPEETFQ